MWGYSFGKTDRTLGSFNPPIPLCDLTSPFSLRMSRLNSFPSRHRKSSPGSKIPHLVAMARAVLILSPVTIRTVIPARWHFRIASGTYWTATKCGVSKLDSVNMTDCVSVCDCVHAQKRVGLLCLPSYTTSFLVPQAAQQAEFERLNIPPKAPGPA